MAYDIRDIKRVWLTQPKVAMYLFCHYIDLVFYVFDSILELCYLQISNCVCS